MKYISLVCALPVWLLLLGASRAAEPPAPPVQHVGEPAGLKPGWGPYVNGLKSLGAFELENAAGSFITATQQAPGNVDYSTARALTLLLQQKYQEGRAEIDRGFAAGQASQIARAIRAFSAALNGDRAGMLTYPRPGTDFEWLISRIGEGLVSPRQPISIQEAVRQFPKVASEFAKLQLHESGGDQASLARGLQNHADKKYVPAIADLADYLGRHPDDWSVRWYYGAALAGAGNFERARRELSIVLCGQPALFEGYAQRAIAAARMGNLSRARKDLAIARQLDSKGKDWLRMVEKVIAEAEAGLPSETASQLFEGLRTAAREGQPLDQLATRLVRAGHSSRLHGDEVYQDKLRRLQWAVAANPKNAKALTALGQFLFDEIEVRGEYVDPGQNAMDYRTQTRRMQQAEIEYARDCFKRALGADASSVAALMGLAQIKYRENLFGDAEDYVRSALALRNDDPAILDMMSRLMKIAAGQSMARALNAASTYSWTEPLANGWERRWTRYGDSAAAEGHARSADGLLKQGDEYTRRALKTLKDTPESLDYLGTLALTRKDFETMRKSYERAVQLVPDKLEFHYALANAYSSLGIYEKYLEHATTGRNLEQTSVGAHLLGAWQSILKSDWKTAADFLTKGARIDPADSRILAFMGAIAEGQQQTQEAAACFRAALAVEEANGALRGSAHGVGLPVSLFDETARAIALRIRLARIIEEQDPAGALVLYEKNLSIEPRLLSPETIALSANVEGRNRAETEQLQMKNHPMLRAVPDAMLPEPSLPADQQKTPPNPAGLLRTSRSLAAVALCNLGRKKEAAEYFSRINTYNAYARRHGVGATFLSVNGIWTPRPVAQIATECSGRAVDEGLPRRRGAGSNGNFPGTRR